MTGRKLWGLRFRDLIPLYVAEPTPRKLMGLGEWAKCLDRLQKCHPRDGQASLRLCCSMGHGGAVLRVQQREKNSRIILSARPPPGPAPPPAPPRPDSGPLALRARPSCACPRALPPRTLGSPLCLGSLGSRPLPWARETEAPSSNPAHQGGCSGLSVCVSPKFRRYKLITNGVVS